MRKLKTIFIKEEIENVHGIKDSVLRDFILLKFYLLILMQPQTKSQEEIFSFFFLAIDKLTLKFGWKRKEPRIAKMVLKKNSEEVERLTDLDVRVYHKPLVPETGISGANINK